MLCWALDRRGLLARRCAFHVLERLAVGAGHIANELVAVRIGDVQLARAVDDAAREWITVAAAEIALGLGIVFAMYRNTESVNLNEVTELRN